MSTGGHYNPTGKNHGAPADVERHHGDFGNIVLPAGKTELSFSDPLAQLSGEHSVIGRGFVLHAGEDDLGRGTGDAKIGSLASGNAGPRMACGTIFFQDHTA